MSGAVLAAMELPLDLLLVHADDQLPVLSSTAEASSAAGQPPPNKVPVPRRLRHDSADPNDLVQQRWGVIAPEGDRGTHLLSLIAPLAEHRSREQGGHPVREYRVPPRMTEAEAIRWIGQVYWDEAVPEEDLPKYLLVLGEPHEVPLALQQMLAGQAFAGRLGFPDDAGYRGYVAKVLAREQAPSSRRAPARALFHAVNDGTRATGIGRKVLLDPIVTSARTGHLAGKLRASEVVEIGEGRFVDPHSFLGAMARPEPGVMLTVSHGCGAPRSGWASEAEQRAIQGAMSFGRGPRLDAAQVANRPFLPGGLWVFMACFSAAVPRESAYLPWLTRLREQGLYGGDLQNLLAGLAGPGQDPFLAALPTAVLASHEGPLGVIGHVDLAWTYSFQDIDDGTARDRPSRFRGVVEAALSGARMGVAHNELVRFFPAANIELSTLHGDESPAGAARRAHLWMKRNDLCGHILLGDPAARVVEPAPAVAARPHLQGAAAWLGFGGAESGAPSAELARKQEIVLAILRGEPVAQVAHRFGVSAERATALHDAYHAAGLRALADMG
ncbi:MAG: helix-turn-helix domain-containing protein [Polyangiaceae bacterium]